MSLSIQSSYASAVTQSSLSTANDKLTTAMERLSTGYAVNSSADDAAGLSIATRMQSQSDGISVAQDNVEDASSMLSTADGALESMVDIVGRMKDLATQAANDTYSTDDRTAMQTEYDDLANQLTSVMENTSFGGTDLLTAPNGSVSAGGLLASTAGVSFQVGASSSETLKVDISSGLSSITSDISAAATVTTSTAAGSELTTASSASDTIDKLETLLTDVSSVRSSVGASINRLDYISDNLTNMQENTDTAIGNIMDADYAAETAEMSKQQLLEKAGISVLGSVGDAQSLVANLLQ
jgi:flagellin